MNDDWSCIIFQVGTSATGRGGDDMDVIRTKGRLLQLGFDGRKKGGMTRKRQ